jgi:hypothetical protein
MALQEVFVGDPVDVGKGGEFGGIKKQRSRQFAFRGFKRATVGTEVASAKIELSRSFKQQGLPVEASHVEAEAELCIPGIHQSSFHV